MKECLQFENCHKQIFNETSMKLINPAEISARILTLLDESDVRMIIVSPYMKISKWYKLINKFNVLKTRGIPIEIYVRDDPENTATYRDLDKLALQYKRIPHLHSKLYLNEKNGIVTSMNLLLTSEFNSLEIGYATESWIEYNDLMSYYHRYIHIGEPVQSEKVNGQPAADLKEIMHGIREELKRNAKNSWSRFAENALHISTGSNNYIFSISDGYLRFTACLRIASGTKQVSIQHFPLIAKKVRNLTAMKVDVHPGPLSDTILVSGQAQHPMKSPCITGILKSEAAIIMESVQNFIDASDDLLVQYASNL